MPLTDADLLKATQRYVPDDSDGTDESERRLSSVSAALDRFSADVRELFLSGKPCPFPPRIIAASVTANPTAVSGLTGWDPRWSEAVELEWPYLTASVGIIPKQLQRFPDGHPRAGRPTVTVDIETDGAEKLRFPGVPVSSGSPGLLRFSSRWTVATLPAALQEPVAVLAAAIYARAMAGVYADAAKPEPGGFDRIQTGDRADRYRELADRLEAQYVGMLAPATFASPYTLRPVAAGEEAAA